MKDVLGDFQITLTESCSEFVQSEYKNARLIVEYGTGGSTLVGAHLGKRLISVESDRDWLDALMAQAEKACISNQITPLLANIGKTENWGYPEDETCWRNWHTYPVTPWQYCRKHALNPDLVLIDGRFRVACFLACCVYTEKPIKILFDDFVDRAHYHVIKEFIQPEKYIDNRLAFFYVEPNMLSSQFILEHVHYFYDKE